MRASVLGLVWACMALGLVRHASGQGLRGGSIYPARPNSTVAQFRLEITVAQGSPACGPMRPVILVNGLFQPTLYANVNDTIQITIVNKIPITFPKTSSGISIHFHGFSMWDQAAYADGTAFVAGCPIAPGTTYTYSFLADESPGTYFWHDHNTVNRANGLQGALVLGLPRAKEIPAPPQPDGEFVLFITDWYNMEANNIAMQLNRPTDPSKATNDTGMAMRIPSASVILVNGKGNQYDCNVNSTDADTTERTSPQCSVTALTTPALPGTPGCTHEVFRAQPDKTYTFRVINAGTQQYLTVCFENHTVTLSAADSTPMDDVPLPGNCVDINSGQRYDVTITMDQPPGNYWISVHTQYSQTPSPSAYAVLQYATAGVPQGLPSSPTPQPADVQPWSNTTEALIVTSDFVLGYNDNYDFETYWMLFNHRNSYTDNVLVYGSTADKTIVFNMTSPLMENGVIKWVHKQVGYEQRGPHQRPPCTCLIDNLAGHPEFLTDHTVPNDTQVQANITRHNLQVSVFDAANATAEIFDTEKASPVRPVAGAHIVPIPHNAIVDVVINNLPSNAMNGDYRNNSDRGFTMQHPIHLHGHKFWVLGVGNGLYNDTVDRENLNWHNPMLRDTVTLPRAGWVYLRFRANNPGLWPLHCHIMWHAFMGQVVVLGEGLEHIKPRTEPGPPCPAKCINSFAPFTKSWLKEQYKDSHYKVPTD